MYSNDWSCFGGINCIPHKIVWFFSRLFGFSVGEPSRTELIPSSEPFVATNTPFCFDTGLVMKRLLVIRSLSEIELAAINALVFIEPN